MLGAGSMREVSPEHQEGETVLGGTEPGQEGPGLGTGAGVLGALGGPGQAAVAPSLWED